MSVKPTGRPTRPRRGGPPRRAGADLHAHAPTRARLLALRVLERVQRAGAYADVLLHSQLARSGLGPVDRAFATELVYGTLRWRGRIDYLLGRFLDRPLDRIEGIAATALRLGAYQILFNDRVRASAAVDEAVRCARAAGAERVTGLVNAVLRRLAQHHASEPLPALDSDPLGHLMHAQSLPAWIAARWLELYGPAEAAALAAACTETPPLTVRANPHRGELAELLDELRPIFPDARPCRYARYGAVLGRRGNATALPSFLAGRFTVQDEASQLVVGLLDPQPGERVLDTCAAPGGKATAIAERSHSTATPVGSTSCAARRGGSSSAGSSAARSTRRSTWPSSRATAGSTACSSTRRARGSAACAAIPTRAGACARPTPRASPDCRRRCSRARVACSCRAACSSTVPARSFRRRTRQSWSRSCASRRSSHRRLRTRCPKRYARSSTSAAICAAGPTATTPTASSPRGSSGAEVSRSELQVARSEPKASEDRTGGPSEGHRDESA